jgi:hypothetical protein
MLAKVANARAVAALLSVLACEGCSRRAAMDPIVPTDAAGDTLPNPCEHPNHPGIRACCGLPDQRPGQNCVPWDLLDRPCSTEGGTEDAKLYRVCCKGLEGIPVSEPLSEPSPDGATCSQQFPLDPTHVCAKCGNGTCGTGENRCNCPQDCG